MKHKGKIIRVGIILIYGAFFIFHNYSTSFYINIMIKTSILIVLALIWKLIILYDKTRESNDRYKESILEGEERYKNLFESIPDPIVAYTEEGIIHVNFALLKMLGYSEMSKIIGKSIFDIVHPEYHSMAKKRIRSLNKTKRGEPLPMIDIKLVKSDGVPIEVEVMSSNHNYMGVCAILTVARDISERKHNQLVIRKMSEALEQVPSSVIITDATGKIEYVNSKFTELTEYTLHEVKGKNPDFLRSGSLPQEYYEKIWKVINTDNRWEGEFHNVKKNGEFYWEHASILPIKDEEGNIINYISAQNDITYIKKIMQQLKEKNEELSKTVEQLNEVQRQLVQQEQLAGIGQLAAGVAHEINNPLGYITGNFHTLRGYVNKYEQVIRAYSDMKRYLEMNNIDKAHGMIQYIYSLEKQYKLDFINEDIFDLLNDTNEGLNRVSEIIKQLRQFATIDQNSGLIMYDLNQGIKNTITVAQNEIKYVAEVKQDFCEIPLIEAIGGQINQVLLNLILNAVHAIDRKSLGNLGVINIRTYYDKKWVYCEIEDNGIGIDKEQQKSIFNPFFTTKEAGQGMGLGLSIAYDIIHKKHSGHIWVNSDKEVGTKITFKLPFKFPYNH